MLNRLLFVGLLSFSVLASFGCAPAEPPAEEEAAPPPPPPAPPPTVYDLGEVDIVAEDPTFTSKNVSFGGIQIGDITNDVLDVLGDQTGQTQNSADNASYVSGYRNGGLVIYTFKATGEIRGIELTTRVASEVASPQLRAWLEDGDLDGMRELMGPEERVVEVPEAGATEYAYDRRGIRFVVYPDLNLYGLRFSYIL